MWPFQKKKE